MNDLTPFFPALRPRLAPMGRRVINSFVEVGNCTLNQIENRFESIFTDEILKRPKANSSERPY